MKNKKWQSFWPCVFDLLRFQQNYCKDNIEEEVILCLAHSRRKTREKVCHLVYSTFVGLQKIGFLLSVPHQNSGTTWPPSTQIWWWSAIWPPRCDIGDRISERIFWGVWYDMNVKSPRLGLRWDLGKSLVSVRIRSNLCVYKSWIAMECAKAPKY